MKVWEPLLKYNPDVKDTNGSKNMKTNENNWHDAMLPFLKNHVLTRILRNVAKSNKIFSVVGENEKVIKLY